MYGTQLHNVQEETSESSISPPQSPVSKLYITFAFNYHNIMLDSLSRYQSSFISHSQRSDRRRSSLTAPSLPSRAPPPLVRSHTQSVIYGAGGVPGPTAGYPHLMGRRSSLVGGFVREQGEGNHHPRSVIFFVADIVIDSLVVFQLVFCNIFI